MSAARLLGLFVALLTLDASAQALPPPSKTVFKCQQDGKVLYSDAPCLGTERVVVEPTRGLDSTTGRARIGEDVRRERHNEQMAQALRPIFGESADQRATRHRRARLPATAQAECRRLDGDIPVAEAAERQATAAARSAIQSRLLDLRRQYRALKC